MDSQSPAPTLDQNTNKGSLLAGFLMGWAAAILGGLVSGGLVFALVQLATYNAALSAISMISGFLPLLLQIGLIVWYGARGQTRSMLGVMLTFASQIALALLLVAACFGYFAYSGGMH